MSWTMNCATSAIALALSCPQGATAPRVSHRGPVWHKIPETSPSDPTSGISTHLDAMRPPAVIADAPHPRAECARYSKRDAGEVRERDDILQRRALDRAGEGNVECLFDLHVGPPGLGSFNGTPTSDRA